MPTRPNELTPLDRLESLARNVWWTWDTQGRRLMQSIEPALFAAHRNNPIAVLRRLPAWRRAALDHDPRFERHVSELERRFDHAMIARSWHDETARGDQRDQLVAYFCMEYGLHESLPLYAGGLGVLAGDLLKSASDLGLPLVAVGILWRSGYYRQEILAGEGIARRRARGGADADIRVIYPHIDFDDLPVEDTGRRIVVPIGETEVIARIWRLMVGRIALYLLDTDVPENPPAARELTRFLYKGGDPDYRIRQEILLGIGGLMALEAMGIAPDLLHLNEGHAAFAPLELARRVAEAGVDWPSASEFARGSSVFTTHTPVPEGNDRFPAKLVMKYFADWPERLGISRREFLALGRENPAEAREWFCMTVLALKLSARANAVSELHGHTARRMWIRLYGAPTPDEVPIAHVTNGVHPPTWIADDARPFYAKHLKSDELQHGPADDPWARLARASDSELWGLRCMLRERMIRALRVHLERQLRRHGAGEDLITALHDRLREDALTIGFARRFALYKRGTLLFSDPRRLKRLLNGPARPVQVIFSGKAHPIDEAGHDYVRAVASVMDDPDLRGRVWIIEDYGLDIGRLLTAGCDLWLNTPLRPMEACGTSGMKGPMNAALNCSILDGWWAEAGLDGRNGWSFGVETLRPARDRAKLSRARQDALDAASLYDTLESRVIPAFYSRDRAGVPKQWARLTRESLRTLGRRFSSHHMLAEYQRTLYWPALEEPAQG